MFMFYLIGLLVIVSEFGTHARMVELVARIIGGPEAAQVVAEEAGYYLQGIVPGFRDTYILKPFPNNAYSNHHKRRLGTSRGLASDARVLWAETQYVKERQKRDYIAIDSSDIPLSRSKRLNYNSKVHKKPPPLKIYDNTFNDELWTQEWYLQDTRSKPDLPKLDLNVLPLYKAGITGKGVRISILDDGIEYTHDDLKNNYDSEISYDCNEEDYNPLPRYEPTKFNSHGTRCAGEIAMTADNGKCGVGIAYNSKIGGVKLLDGLVTDRIEGTALAYALHLVDIYSASWGPNDDGRTVDGPGRLAKESLEKGIKEGRNGKGVLYVWASGNGGSKNDNCNCDGYLTTPYTISIGSASQKGEFPWYGEACASTLAVTYSSGAYKDQMIATTDLNNECTIKHTGTSASAPLAAGIIALALEVNPELTWRDVQHLIVWTSELAPLADNPGWQKNAAGLWFNTRFGFGLMNAFGLVKAAANWTTVPSRHTCVIPARNIENRTISYKYAANVEILTSGCRQTANEVKYVEHVELLTSINYSVRGALEVYLVSPSGSKVQLLGTRIYDMSDKGFNRWIFMSVMTWGELAEGSWIISVTDNVGPRDNKGYLEEVSLILHGTKHLPEHMRHGFRNYNENYNRLQNRINSMKLFNSDMYDNYDTDSKSDFSFIPDFNYL